MAKRREIPPVNPLSTDLIAAAIAPVDKASAPMQAEMLASKPKAAKDPEPAAKSGIKERGSKKSLRRTPREQKTLRVRFPDTEFEENEVLTKALRKLMGDSKVSESDITRALWSLARRAEEAMNDLSVKAPQVPRPPNGDWMAKAEYDDAVAHFLHLAIKRMGAGE